MLQVEVASKQLHDKAGNKMKNDRPFLGRVRRMGEGEKRGMVEWGSQFFRLHLLGCVIITTNMPIIFSYSVKILS
jgi:hypothetical protein